MFRKFLSIALIAAFAAPVLSQSEDKKDQKEEAEKLRKEAVVFLRETIADVGTLRTLENRISFMAEMGGLLWHTDEREARGIMNGAIAEFKELLIRYNNEMNTFGTGTENTEMYTGGPIMAMGEVTERIQVERRFRTAIQVRQQIASSIADHDPDLALSFMYDTDSVISNPGFRAQLAGLNSYFEFSLLQQVAEKNAAKASQLALKTLDKGVQYQHLELLRKIYEKDVEKGIEFGAVLLSKAASQEPKTASLYILGMLLEFGQENGEEAQKKGAKPVYTQAELRDLADVLARNVLETDSPEMAARYISSIEKYQPGRAAQIRAKMPSRNSPMYPTGRNPSRGRSSNSNSNISYAMTDEGVSNAASQGSQNQNDGLEESVKKLAKGELPKEEREKVVAEARRILMQSPGKDRKITGLSLLAAQVSRAGDKELAAELMRDAESLVNPDPKNYQDFMFTWMLANGYTGSDPDKAFSLLDSTIGRANDLISAFVRVGEFIDVAGEMVVDGEVQVGAFGGGMIRGLSRDLGMVEGSLVALAKTDFEKTKSLTNRFDRPEVRVLAKLLVLRSVLGSKPEVTATGEAELVK